MTNDNERLWLSAERTAFGSSYRLALLGDGPQKTIGTIHPLAGGGWSWTATLGKEPGMHANGTSPSAEQASEDQFDALTRMQPERFARLAA